MPPKLPGTVVFFHPDLGIGGAERLVVDAAVGLQSRGHKVVIYTNHCDPSHSFDECNDGTLDVRVRGNWLIPPSIASRLTILCAILRHIHLLIHIHLSGELSSLNPSAVIADQLSAGLPLLRHLLLPQVPIVFYCHFPDLLLARGRESALKRLYRVPFDTLEEFSMSYSDAVAVNSNFTKGVVASTWPRLANHVNTQVVYPCVDTEVKPPEAALPDFLNPNDKIILSINRFERKKDIALAIKAFAAIPASSRKGVRLVIAGGYDKRVSENVEYLTELQALADSFSLSHDACTPSGSMSIKNPSAEVLFLCSVPGPLKCSLLHQSRLLVYTPSNEHFGIVPLEAMLANLPVLAANTGGPVETVLDGVTGWLREPDDSKAWSEVMAKALSLTPDQKQKMGEDGAQRVKDLFGRDQMALTLDNIIQEGVTSRKNAKAGLGFGFCVLGLLAGLAAVAAAVVALFLNH